MAGKINKGKRKKSPYIGIVIFILLAVVAGIGLLKYLENLKLKSQLLEKSEKVNLRLESSLFKAGLSKKEIISSSEELREIEGGKILYCKRVIVLRKGLLFENIEKIVRGLTKLKEVDVEESQDHEITKKQGKKYTIKLNNILVQELVIYPAPEKELAEKPAAPAEKPLLALVIDDFGESLKQAKLFLDINAPLTFSILPGLTYSTKISQLVSNLGKEVILHCPMEPENYPHDDPGPGKILSGMNKIEMLELLEKNIRSVPNAVGFNNHMGSELTKDKEKMEVIMSWAKMKNLFFIDSRTTPQTRAAETATEFNIKVAERNVFLDNIREIPEIEKEISKLALIAKKNGKALGIGHPYPETAVAIQMMLPFLEKEGIEIVPASSVVE